MTDHLQNFPSSSVPSVSFADTTIIVPTLNENGNILRMLKCLSEEYRECRIIVADDGSRDGTQETVRNFAYPYLTMLDRSNQALHGLTMSVLEAAALVGTKYFIVMDADGQHPVETVRAIINLLRTEGGLVIARRKAIDADWAFGRRMISFFGNLMGKIALLMRGKNYFQYDITSGFFGCEKSFWDEKSSQQFKKEHFQLCGYKVLFDFLKYLPAGKKISETAYRFAKRQVGVSKINRRVYFEYAKSCFLP